MAQTSRQKLGDWGERLAADFLRRKGYKILAAKARTRYGELDLVARHAGQHVTVFIEVKTRASRAFGLPEESVTPAKQAHLLAAAQAYLLEHPELDGDWRIDVIAIQQHPDPGEEHIVHFENAVWP